MSTRTRKKAFPDLQDARYRYHVQRHETIYRLRDCTGMPLHQASRIIREYRDAIQTGYINDTLAQDEAEHRERIIQQHQLQHNRAALAQLRDYRDALLYLLAHVPHHILREAQREETRP